MKAATYIIGIHELMELLNLPDHHEVIRINADAATFLTYVTVTGDDLPEVPLGEPPPCLPRAGMTRYTITGPDGHEYHREVYDESPSWVRLPSGQTVPSDEPEPGGFRP